MLDMVRRLAWFFAASSAVAFVIFLAAGSYLYARESGETAVGLVRDELSPNLHHISGMIVVPATCAELSVSTELVSTTTYHLRFNTWETPAIDCVREATPRSFRTMVIAPALGLHFFATLDGKPYPIAVLPVIK